LKLELRDHGVGFDSQADANGPGGVGLMGTRERADHLGGSVRVESARGRGTLVRLLPPLKKAPASGVSARLAGRER
jgi:two-component system, NarL family, sensor histidine kinase UhpB